MTHFSQTLSAADTANSYADYSSNGNTVSAALNHFANIYDQQYTINSTLLQQGIGTRRIYISLRQANATSALQALCHAMGDNIWWYKDSHANIIITSKNAAPIVGATQTTIYSSTINNSQQYHSAVIDILSPWQLANQGGVSLLNNKQRWISTLSARGHQDLKHILRILEQGATQIPTLSMQQRAQAWPLTTDIQGTQWAHTLQTLSAEIKCSISISQSLMRKQQAITLTACLLKDLIPQLRSYGIYARWIEGVLSCDSSPIVDRQHSASGRHIVGLSLRHLATAENQEKIVAHLRRSIMPQYWKRSGCSLLYISQQQTLLIAAHESALSAVMAELRRIDSRSE